MRDAGVGRNGVCSSEFPTGVKIPPMALVLGLLWLMPPGGMASPGGMEGMDEMAGIRRGGVERLEAERRVLEEEKRGLPERPVPEQELAVGMYIGGRFSPETSRWMQVDLGEARALDAVVLMPAYVASKWAYGFPLRYRVEGSMRDDFAESQTLLDRSAEDQEVPLGPVYLETPGIRCRYLRVTATRLAVHPLDSGRSLFCLSELLAFSGGRNVALRSRVTAPGSAESPPTWSLQHVVDGSTALGLAMRSDAERAGNGWHSGISRKQETLKWVQVDLGQPQRIEEVRLVPARPSDFLERAGFGFPLRFRVEVSDRPDFETVATVFETGERDFVNPGGNAVGFPGRGVEGRYVRVSATKLWQRHEDFVFALAELEVVAEGRNVAKGRAVTGLDETVTAAWKAECLVDGRGSSGVLLDSQRWLEQIARRVEVEGALGRLERALGEARRRAEEKTKAVLSGMLVGVVSLGGAMFWWVRQVRRKAERRLREQIARDLHDEIGSSLGSIALMSERALRKSDVAALEEIGHLATDAAASMRGILWMVREAGVPTLGELRETLRTSAAQMLGGREWVWEGTLGEGDCRKPLPFHRDVFLFLKEALHNVVRHSGATHVWIGFGVERGRLCVGVRDNGKGFDPSGDFGGSGIASMRYRAGQLGAELRMESEPGAGARVYLEVPLT
jgi:signal transduction histidine kinase